MMIVVNIIRALKVFIRHVFLEPYFCFWSHLYLRRWQPLVIVITGSVGKTNLLNILQAQLGNQAAYSHQSNTKVGIACNMLNLTTIKPGKRWRWLTLILIIPFKALFAKVRLEDKYIVEYDTYDFSSAKFFKRWLRPNICLWTSISQSHLQNFEKEAKRLNQDTFEMVIKEFAKIVKSADQQIFAFKDNKLMRQSLRDSQTPVNYLKDDLIDYRVSLKSTTFKFKHAKFVFSDPLPKEIAQLLILLQALMSYLQIPLREDLRNWQLPPGRSSLLKGYKGSYLIDSSFNAQFEAMEAILSMFESIKEKTKWLVCGDMIEQGDFVEEGHLKIAHQIVKLNPQKVFLVGEQTKKYIYPVLKKQIKDLYWRECVDKQFLADLKKDIKGQEVILFKGAGFLNILVEALLKNPADCKLLHNKSGSGTSLLD